jgi:ornithine carbamoyltransferase
MERAAPHAVFVHCLPARRGEEVTAEVFVCACSIVWSLVVNHLPVAQWFHCWLAG